MNRRLFLVAAALTLTSCVTTTPVTRSYSTRVDGHAISASYSGKEGLSIAAERLRTLLHDK